MQSLVIDIVLTCRLIDLALCVKYPLQYRGLVLSLSILYILKDVQTFKLTVAIYQRSLTFVHQYFL